MKLSTAIQGFLLSKRVAGASPNTIRNYTLSLKRLAAHFDAEPDLDEITVDQVRELLDQLMTTQIALPGIAPRPSKTLSAKTIRNIHTCWMSLWTWAIAEGHATGHIIKRIHVPQPEDKAIEPFTRDQVKALLDATKYSQPWERLPATATRIPKRRRLRDRAILLILLDTGIRASELCGLTIADVDIAAGTAKVCSKGRLNAGQGKERFVRFSASTGKAIWSYLAERDVLDRNDKSGSLFVTRENRILDRRVLAKHIKRLGRRADIERCHAHRFRHTFAINYLRNGGDIFTLQALLGATPRSRWSSAIWPWLRPTRRRRIGGRRRWTIGGCDPGVDARHELF